MKVFSALSLLQKHHLQNYVFTNKWIQWKTIINESTVFALCFIVIKIAFLQIELKDSSTVEY